MIDDERIARYCGLLGKKASDRVETGVRGVNISQRLFPFQRHCAEFTLRVGRAALFLDTGLGKTLCELEFAHHSAEATNGRSLILAPLAVAHQIAAEGAKFGYDATVIREQSSARDGINICNYDRLDRLDLRSFGAVVLDESGILKSFSGATSMALRDAVRGHRFRLAATATPSPNDHMELGQHSDFVGSLSPMEMLSRFFVNETSTASQSWRLKGHAKTAFWDWVATWARCASMPSDLGDFSDDGYHLPPINYHFHRVSTAMAKADGELFGAAMSATSMFEIKRQTAADRADAIAGAVAANQSDPWVVWCDTNGEADLLRHRIDGSAEVRGSDAIEKKEETLQAFASGQLRVLITKPSICGFGLNWQHCAHVAFVGRSFSYEDYYQAVRRCWRFGQQRQVEVHVALGTGDEIISSAIERKAAAHATMRQEMAAAMQRDRSTGTAARTPYQIQKISSLPAWMM